MNNKDKKELINISVGDLVTINADGFGISEYVEGFISEYCTVLARFENTLGTSMIVVGLGDGSCCAFRECMADKVGDFTPDDSPDDSGNGFIFENAEEYNLEQLIGDGDDAAHVINAWLGVNSNILQVIVAGEWTLHGGRLALDKKSVCRVLAKPKSPLDIALSEVDKSVRIIATQNISGDFIEESDVLRIIKKLAESLGGDR